MTETQLTQSAEETMTFASCFAGRLQRGDTIALYGELGSGKTQFVKGICRRFLVQTHVTSPTFVILNRYEGADNRREEILLYHFDLYRIKSLTEIYDLGYEEFLQGDGVCCIEWAEILGKLLPERRYDVRFFFGENESERRIEITQASSP